MSSPLSHFSYADSAKDKDGPQIGLLTKITKRQYVLLELNRLSILGIVFLVTVTLLTHVIFAVLLITIALIHVEDILDFVISENRV